MQRGGRPGVVAPRVVWGAWEWLGGGGAWRGLAAVCARRPLPRHAVCSCPPCPLPGTQVVEGIAKVGTPICVPSRGGVDLGRIASLEKDHKPVDTARRGDAVAMKIEVRLLGWGLGRCWGGCGVRVWGVSGFAGWLAGCVARIGYAGAAGRCSVATCPVPTRRRARPPPTAQATKPEEASRSYERHFDHTDELVSRITCVRQLWGSGGRGPARRHALTRDPFLLAPDHLPASPPTPPPCVPCRSRKSIDVLKDMFRDELSKDDWKLVIKLKRVFKID